MFASKMQIWMKDHEHSFVSYWDVKNLMPTDSGLYNVISYAGADFDQFS